MPVVTITTEANRLIKIDRHTYGPDNKPDDNLTTAECLICGHIGWLRGRYGLPAGSKKERSGDLVHNAKCPLSKVAEEYPPKENS